MRNERSDAKNHESNVSERTVFTELLIYTKKIPEQPDEGDWESRKLINQFRGTLMDVGDLEQLPPNEWTASTREIRQYVDTLLEQEFIGPSDTQRLIEIVKSKCPNVDIPINATPEYLLAIIRRELLVRPISEQSEIFTQVQSAKERIINNCRMRAMGIVTLQGLARLFAALEGRPFDKEIATVVALPASERIREVTVHLIANLVDAETIPSKSFFPDEQTLLRQIEIHYKWPSIDHFYGDIESVADLFISEYRKTCEDIDKKR